jgi:hypothetical protein
MRVFCAIAVLVVVALGGYASARPSAQSESIHASITSGERLLLALEPDRTGYECVVIAVQGDFVGCKADTERAGFGRMAYEHWYNLKLIVRIDRPVKRN